MMLWCRLSKPASSGRRAGAASEALKPNGGMTSKRFELLDHTTIKTTVA